MSLSETIEKILEPSLTHKGYDIVRVLISGHTRKTVQLMIERHDGSDVTIDDCVTVSRHSAVLLEVDDPIPFAYVLEVSSPGVERPLVKPKDFSRFAGHTIQVHLAEPLLKRKKWVGRLKSANDSTITMDIEVNDREGEGVAEVAIHYDEILKAKLYSDFEQSLKNASAKKKSEKKNAGKHLGAQHKGTDRGSD